MKTNVPSSVRILGLLLGSLLLGLPQAQATIPTVLTDSIHRGSGVIDLLRDVQPDSLANYLSTNGRLYLGIDINESSNSPASPSSQGVAVEQMRLLITTTAGDFSFADFYTSTSAMIRAAGAEAPQQYQTLFGQSGANDLRSGTDGFELSTFDDVITIDNIQLTGDILSARLEVKFLSTETGANAGTAEKFFQFSGGFESLAILTAADAASLESAAIGQSTAPTDLQISQTTTPLTTSSTNGTSGGGNGSVPSAPGAPTPTFFLFLAAAGLLGLKQWQMQRSRANRADRAHGVGAVPLAD